MDPQQTPNQDTPQPPQPAVIPGSVISPTPQQQDSAPMPQQVYEQSPQQAVPPKPQPTQEPVAQPVNNVQQPAEPQAYSAPQGPSYVPPQPELPPVTPQQPVNVQTETLNISNPENVFMPDGLSEMSMQIDVNQRPSLLTKLFKNKIFLAITFILIPLLLVGLYFVYDIFIRDRSVDVLTEYGQTSGQITKTKSLVQLELAYENALFASSKLTEPSEDKKTKIASALELSNQELEEYEKIVLAVPAARNPELLKPAKQYAEDARVCIDKLTVSSAELLEISEVNVPTSTQLKEIGDSVFDADSKKRIQYGNDTIKIHEDFREKLGGMSFEDEQLEALRLSYIDWSDESIKAINKEIKEEKTDEFNFGLSGAISDATYLTTGSDTYEKREKFFESFDVVCSTVTSQKLNKIHGEFDFGEAEKSIFDKLKIF